MDNLQLHFAPYCPFKMFLSRIINHYIYIELYVAGRRTGPVRGSAAVGAVSKDDRIGGESVTLIFSFNYVEIK